MSEVPRIPETPEPPQGADRGKPKDLPEQNGHPMDGQAAPGQPAAVDGLPPGAPNLKARTRGRRLVRAEDLAPSPLTPAQRLLILDTWRRSGLPARDFAPLVGVSRHTLYAWKQRFEKEGPGGLVERPRGSVRGTRLPDLTKRAILMLKEGNPDYGCERISNLLARGPALAASPGAVARVLKEAGYVRE